MKFKKFLKEEFNQTKAIKDAETWLRAKYGEIFDYKYMENMALDSEVIRSFDISVGEEKYQINVRKFMTQDPSEKDTIGFDVLPTTVEPEEAPE